MDSLGAYFIAVAVVVLLFVFSALNFVRYRFKGDRTYIYIIIFSLLFAASVFLTLNLAFV